MNKNKELIKAGFSIVTMIGVDEIIGNAIKHVNPKNMSILKKACVGFASLAISGCVISAANKYVDNTIDEVFNFIEGIVNKKNEEVKDNIIHMETEEV